MVWKKVRAIIRFLLGKPDEYPALLTWGNWFVVVLIPAYNEEKCIASTIRSVKSQTLYKQSANFGGVGLITICVADDCSTDRTREIALAEGARVVTTPKNTGTKSRAQNYALSKMQYNSRVIIITIDADTILAPDALEKIIQPLQDESVASACGFVIPQRIKTMWEMARFIEYLYDIEISKQGQNLVHTPIVSSGCFSAYRLNTLLVYGGFPERTLVEDMDLTWRQLLYPPLGVSSAVKRFKIVLVAEACCYPLEPATFKVYRAQVSRWIRGFLELIKLYNVNLIRRPSLGFFAMWNLFEGLAYVLMIPTMIYAIYNRNIIVDLLVGQWLLGILTVIFVSISEGIKRKMLGLTLVSLPFYFIVAPVRATLFWEALIKQWILKEKLVLWEKGH